MKFANILESITQKERKVLSLSEDYALEKDPVKRKILRYRIERYMYGMLLDTRIYCESSEGDTFEERMRFLKKAHNPDEYITVGDVTEFFSTKFRILEPLNPKPYEEPVSSC